MHFVLNIYKKDSRIKSGKRLCGSYEFERKDLAQMQREARELWPLYREADGYTMEILQQAPGAPKIEL
jgi:hypothetical protein